MKKSSKILDYLNSPDGLFLLSIVTTFLGNIGSTSSSSSINSSSKQTHPTPPNHNRSYSSSIKSGTSSRIRFGNHNAYKSNWAEEKNRRGEWLSKEEYKAASGREGKSRPY